MRLALLRNSLFIFLAVLTLELTKIDIVNAQDTENPAAVSAFPSPTAVPTIPPVVYILKTPVFDLSQIPTAYLAKELNAAKELMQKELFDEALNKINAYLDNPPARAPLQRAFLIKGICLQRLGKDEEAVKAFLDFLKLQGASSDTLYFKAQSLARLGKSQEAISDLEEALWFGKNTLVNVWQVNLQIALIYRTLNDNKKATEKLNLALASQANFVPALQELADINLIGGDKASAIKNIRSALAVSPNNSEIELQLVRALLTQSDRVNGEKDINEALLLSKKIYENPSLNKEASQKAGIAYLRSCIEAKKLDDAEKILNQLLKNDPRDIQLQRFREQIKIELKSTDTPTVTATTTPTAY